MQVEHTADCFTVVVNNSNNNNEYAVINNHTRNNGEYAVHLVKADTFELATKVDTLRTDTENCFLLESTLGVD